MREAGVGTIVFSSTCATYGDPVRVPIDETHPQAPVNPYGESKLMVEQMLRWYGEIHGLRWMALRYFNAAGADPDGEIGEDHDPETHLIPLVIGAALGTRPPVKSSAPTTRRPTAPPSATTSTSRIWPTRICARSTGSARARRARRSISAPASGHSVREVVDTVSRVGWPAGSRRRVTAPSRRSGGARRSPGRAREVLGWTCRYSDLETIVRHAWAWHEKHG